MLHIATRQYTTFLQRIRRPADMVGRPLKRACGHPAGSHPDFWKEVPLEGAWSLQTVRTSEELCPQRPFALTPHAEPSRYFRDIH